MKASLGAFWQGGCLHLWSPGISSPCGRACAPMPGVLCFLLTGYSCEVKEAGFSCVVTRVRTLRALECSLHSVYTGLLLRLRTNTAQQNTSWCQHLVAAVGSCKAVLCRFSDLVKTRGAAGKAEGLAAVLRAGSPGAAQPVWDTLASLPMPAQFVAGELDTKFAGIAAKMASLTQQDNRSAVQNGTEYLQGTDQNAAATAVSGQGANDSAPELSSRGAVMVDGCGHAIHTERPEALVPIIRNFVQSAA